MIAGDGIGPAIVEAALAALDVLGAPFHWDTQIAGLGGVEAAGDPLPSATLESNRKTRQALKGPLETSKACTSVTEHDVRVDGAV